MKKLNAFVHLSFCMLFLFGCGSSGDDRSGLDGNGIVETNLVLKDSFNQDFDTFIQGEEIEFVLTLLNDTNDELILNYPNSKRYDIYIMSSSDEEVWRWSSGFFFADVESEVVVQPRQIIEVSETWNQRRSNGEDLDLGEYTVYGTFSSNVPVAEFTLYIE